MLALSFEIPCPRGVVGHDRAAILPSLPGRGDTRADRSVGRSWKRWSVIHAAGFRAPGRAAMPLGVRIVLVYFLFVGLAGWFVLSTVMDEVRPVVRQSTEETLVDTANLLAEILRDEVKSGRLAQGNLAELLKAYGRRQPQAHIWGVQKSAVSHRIYVTDARGIVLLDS